GSKTIAAVGIPLRKMQPANTRMGRYTESTSLRHQDSLVNSGNVTRAAPMRSNDADDNRIAHATVNTPQTASHHIPTSFSACPFLRKVTMYAGSLKKMRSPAVNMTIARLENA